MTHLGSCSCGRTWTSLTAAHCTACHGHFSTVANFDAHRPRPLRADGTPACGDPAALTHTKKDGTVVPLFKAVERSDGVVWVSWSEDPRFAEASA